MASGDLTTLALVKIHMGISDASKDAIINQLIPQLSASIATYCDREFYLHDYRDFVDTVLGNILYLPQYPVTRVKRIVSALAWVMKVKTTRAGCKGATIEVSNSEVLTQQWGDAEASNDIDLTTEDTLTKVKTALEGFAGEAWQAEIRSGYESHLSADLIEQPGLPALSPDFAELQIPDYDALFTDYILTQENGRLETKRGQFPDGRIFIEYQAGYGSDVTGLPSDLVGLATAIVSDAVRGSGADKGMKSEKWPDYSYTRLDSKDIDELLERYESELSFWRRVSL